MEDLSAGAIAAFCGFGGGAVLGFSARWGRFCTLSAIETAILGRDDNGLRLWGLAIAVAIAGAYALDLAGIVDIEQSFYISAPTALMANAVGGLLFGIGMALAGTCGYGALARIGGGDLKSVVTFLVMGVTAYATLRGATAYLRVFLFEQPIARETPASFAHLLSGQTAIGAHVWAFAMALAIAGFCLSSSAFRASRKKIFTGVLVGAVIVWGWYSTGFLAADEFDPYPLENYTFSAPLGETIMYLMTMSGASLKFGIGAVFGVIAGAAITSLFQGHFRWEACDDAREMRRQIFGGFLMGFGGVLAFGCTIGQGLSAASLLAWSAPVSLIAIFVGAWIGLQYLIGGSLIDPVRGLFSARQ